MGTMIGDQNDRFFYLSRVNLIDRIYDYISART